MRALPVLVRGGSILVVVAVLTGCFRERIRLGDGPIDASGHLSGYDAGIGSAPNESSSEGQSESQSTAPGETSNSTTEDNESTESSSTHSDTGSDPDVPAPDAGNSCVRGQVSGKEMLWIGDSWLRIPGNQETGVEIRARDAGVLGADETYTNRARAAQYLVDIVGQYEAEVQAGAPPKVLIMNGGTWDTIQSRGSEESVTQVVAEFEEFLARVASDGSVEHVVYMLCPELPTIYGVAQLRPGLTEACSSSTVPCHFLDLQPLWADHPEYTDSSGIQASVAGAEVIAVQIWSIMQDQCIAQ